MFPKPDFLGKAALVADAVDCHYWVINTNQQEFKVVDASLEFITYYGYDSDFWSSMHFVEHSESHTDVINAIKEWAPSIERPDDVS